MKKVTVDGRNIWFSGLMLLKGRVIEPTIVDRYGMKELLEKVKF